MGGLTVEPADVAWDKSQAKSEFRARAQRERARIVALERIVEAVLGGTWTERTSPAVAAARVRDAAETSQVRSDAELVIGACTTGSRAELSDALEQLKYDDDGLASQAGEYDPGFLDRLWLDVIDNPIAAGVIVTGVAADTILGIDAPEAENGRDAANVEKGKALGTWALGFGLVALAIAAAAAAVIYGGKKT